MRVDDWLARAAEALPHQPALIANGRVATFAELERDARATARRLAGLGIGAGDRVALARAPDADQVVLLHALTKLDAVAAPLDPRAPAPETERLLEALGARLIVRDAAEVLEAPEATDVALAEGFDTHAPQCVIHTSGTNRVPTPVELTYGNHLWSAIAVGVRIGVAPTDRWLCCMPLHHIGGLSIVLRCALYRIPVVLAPFDPETIAALLEAQRVTIVSLVPTMLTRLLDAQTPLDRLRCALLGGGPAPLALVERALDAGGPITPTYGLTEAASQVATMPPGETRRKPGSAGPPILGTDVEIDERGRICVRGPTVAPGVANADGWLVTGDLGRLDDDGYLYVLGRADDVIVTGGKNVSPTEVEDVLVRHPAVADAAVHGRDDPEWQQAVIASVVLVRGETVTAAALRRFCRERLAPHKVPKDVAFVAELPRSAQGKLLRDRLSKPA
jgi:O-succinylbenzoic acid--CoA ligase